MNSKMLLIASLLAGCASTPPTLPIPQTAVITKYVYADCGIPPAREQISLSPVVWDIQPDETGNQRFTLLAEEYQKLGVNTAEILKGVQELVTEIEYYEKCVGRDNENKEDSTPSE